MILEALQQSPRGAPIHVSVYCLGMDAVGVFPPEGGTAACL